MTGGWAAYRGRRRAVEGMTLVEISIVVAMLGLLAAIALPSLAQARRNSQTKICLNNLRLISAGQEQYSMDYGVETTALLDLCGATGYLKKEPLCPRGGDYALSTVGTSPECSAYNATTHAATL